MNPDSPGSRDLSEAERAVLRRLTRANLVAGLGIGCFAAVSPFAFYAALGILRGALPVDAYAAVAIGVIAAAVGLGCLLLRRARRMVRSALLRGYGDLASMTPEEVAELTESRREIVAAFEIERRRIERDLHDGAQQFLVTASMDVGEASLLLDSATVGDRVVPERMAQVRRLLDKAQDDSEAALRSLRSTVAGIHPKILSDLGLEAAVQSLCSLSSLDVVLRVPHPLPAMPEGVVAAGYFLVCESLTNAAKYAPGARVTVLLAADESLHVSVSDEGPGGAVIRPDGGLSGMRERLAAFGGTMGSCQPRGRADGRLGPHSAPAAAGRIRSRPARWASRRPAGCGRGRTPGRLPAGRCRIRTRGEGMKLIVADDSALFREGMVGLLERQGHEVLAQAATAPELLAAAARHAADVLVTDVRMPPGMADDGLRAAVELREVQPATGIMVLSQYVAPAYATRLFEPAAPAEGVGGLGYLLKDRVARVADFIRSLQVVAAGGVVVDPEVAASLVRGGPSRFADLTAREVEVLELMAQGLSNQQICRKLFLSSAAVSKHVANVFSKLGMAPGEENRRVRAVLAYLTETSLR